MRLISLAPTLFLLFSAFFVFSFETTNLSTELKTTSSRMEPVTAFGLAAGILQFVQFSSDIFKAACDSYQTLQQDNVDRICERLKELSNELDDSLPSAAVPTSHPGRQPLLPREHESKEEILLRDLARRCRQDCEKLVMRLGRLRSGSGPRQFWASLKEALSGSLSSGKDSLRQLQERIKQHESTLTVHMCAVIVWVRCLDTL